MRNRSLAKRWSVGSIALAVAACSGQSGNNVAGNDANAAAEEAPPVTADNAAANSAPTVNGGSEASETYSAGGTEPFWSLTVGGGRMTYDPADGPDVSETLPAQTPIANGYRYVGTQMTVEVVHTACNNGMSEETFADTVRVTVGGQTLNGCGGQGDGVN